MAYAPALDVTTLFEVILAVSLKHCKRRREGGRGSKGREVGGVRGGTPPPPTVYGHSNTSLHVPLYSHKGGVIHRRLVRCARALCTNPAVSDP